MTFLEAKNLILFKHHKNIDFWYRIIGEIVDQFELSCGFEDVTASVTRNLNGKSCIISCHNGEWSIIEPEGWTWNGYVWTRV